MDTQLFAVERYGRQPAGRPAPRLPLTPPSRLVGVIQLTDDDVELALVEGTDPESVRASMTAAGWRVDRVTSAGWIAVDAGDPQGESATDQPAGSEGAER
jgi:hypothetical protein